MSARQLWVQRHLRGPLSESQFEPVKNRPYPSNKPAEGGLWTSTYHDTFGSEWVQWSLADCPEDTWPAWLLVPRADVRIYHVDTYSDLDRLINSYPHPGDHGRFGPGPDFEKIARDFDGLHLTVNGERETHMSFPADFYSWDCESTLWFRWAFESVENLGERTFISR